MKKVNLNRALKAAVEAAKKAGNLLHRNLHTQKTANTVSQHDIKLELDVRSQKLIEAALKKQFSEIPVLGEEGISAKSGVEYRWVVDPIDGTVNFAYTIPHACVSIALQNLHQGSGKADYADGYDTVVGAVYDPFTDELWTAIRGGPARLNGKIIHSSNRRHLNEAVVSIGFTKSRATLEATLPFFNELVHKVRKIRMMGSATLALTYTATGRFDAYVEREVRIWDIAAGGLILQCAGGDFFHEPISGDHAFRMIASNPHLRKKIKLPPLASVKKSAR